MASNLLTKAKYTDLSRNKSIENEKKQFFVVSSIQKDPVNFKDLPITRQVEVIWLKGIEFLEGRTTFKFEDYIDLLKQFPELVDDTHMQNYRRTNVYTQWVAIYQHVIRYNQLPSLLPSFHGFLSRLTPTSRGDSEEVSNEIMDGNLVHPIAITFFNLMWIFSESRIIR